MRAALLALVLIGCRARTPTYHRDVAPILARHCADCHHPGGVAPVPPLQDYANARVYAQPIRFAVQTRRMPPWGADNTGLCGTWRGARWLTSDEISTVARWQEAGAPEGEPAPAVKTTTATPPFHADAALEAPDYQPGLGAGGYRCFVADPGLARDRLLSAIKVNASDARGLAQLTLFALDSPAADAQAAALDDADAAPGYSCFGTARVADARLVASWTWPAPVLRLPGGVRLHGGRKVVVQIHYNIKLPGGDYRTATRVELELDDGASEAQVLPLAAGGPLQPGQRYVAVENVQPVRKRMQLLGVAPRMHIRGETLHVSLERGARTTCLGDFDHWHFDNQQLFVAEKPATLEPGDKLRISCAFGTLGRVQPVVFGDGIDDEECVAYLFVRER